MIEKTLDVLIEGVRAGELTQNASGSLSFRYHRGYRGVALSTAMPLSTREFRDKTVLPYLWGLLPEDPAARRTVAAGAGVSPNNPFALLEVIGLDCPGAVQFCMPGSSATREERLVPISEAAIASRLALGRDPNSGWLAANEHWSLGGQQSKFALRKKGDLWYSCEGSAATTHILKSGVRGLTHQALNEHICMRLAAVCGIPTAKAEYCEFRGDSGVEPAIVVERYDRRWEGLAVRRLHQEDICQALGCLPNNKYTMDGGPGCADILRLLLSTGENAQVNAANFLQMLFFNYLLAATDAHAKNYSIVLSEDGSHHLAPMYDVASIAPYVNEKEWRTKPPKLAMSVGGENRVGRIDLSHLRKLVEQSGLENVGITAEGCADLIVHYAEMIPDRLAQIFDSLSDTASARASIELRAHMEKPIVQLCEKARSRLGQ